MDWSSLFRPTVPAAEIVLRGSVVYLALFFAVRVLLKREAGTVSLADLLMVVLIADATQNAMAARHESLGDGLILAATLIAWNFVLDWLAFRFPVFERFFRPPPLLLVKDGRILWRNLRRELITREELMSQIRQHGIADLSEVESARMEGDGRITAIQKKS